MRKPLKALIVEDREPDADLMVLEMRHVFSVTYDRVETEEQYVRHLADRPDVVIADYNLPRFSGIRALEILRSQDLETPFILVSGALAEGEAAAILNKGANDYLLKASLLRLGPAIEKALAQRQAVRAKEEAEDLYHQSEARYKALFEQAGEAVVVLDANTGVALEANPRAAELFGLSLDEIVSRPFRSLFPESMRERYDACMRELGPAGSAPPPSLEPGERSAGVSPEAYVASVSSVPSRRYTEASHTARMGMQIRRPDGAEAEVDIAAARVQVAGNRSVVQAFLRDVTERNRLQKQLAGERDKLEDTVELRTTELREAVAQLEATVLRLEEASRHKSQFLRSMSHELRTPLNSILGFTDLLTSGFVGLLTEQQLSYVQQIESGGSHLLNLIGDLLDVARIDSGSVVLEKSAFAPPQVCDHVARMLTSQTREKKLHLHISHDPGVGLIEADLQKARQIMLNLLTNAVKFTPTDGTVTITTEPAGADWVRITVADTGIGIAEEDLTRVFEEFYQSDRKRDQGLGGTGIGLALTKRLVELHGGTIEVRSSPGDGAAFSFTLPMRPLAPSEAGAIRPIGPVGPIITPGVSPATGEAWVGQLTILVVADRSANGDLLETALRARRHHVVRATCCEDALRRAESSTPDAVILDLDDVIAKGLDLARALRSDARFAAAPILLVTADATDETANEAHDAGCDACMAKPVQPSIVLTEISRLVAKRLRTAPMEATA